jgi:hypothetical protein
MVTSSIRIRVERHTSTWQARGPAKLLRTLHRFHAIAHTIPLIELSPTSFHRTAGIGFGIVMPRVIKAVIGDIDERHAGLASGMVMTALQIGSALGIAIVGGFFTSLSAREPACRHMLARSAMQWRLMLACSFWDELCLYAFPARDQLLGRMVRIEKGVNDNS